jgi:hypothetical protein
VKLSLIFLCVFLSISSAMKKINLIFPKQIKIHWGQIGLASRARMRLPDAHAFGYGRPPYSGPSFRSASWSTKTPLNPRHVTRGAVHPPSSGQPNEEANVTRTSLSDEWATTPNAAPCGPAFRWHTGTGETPCGIHTRIFPSFE